MLIRIFNESSEDPALKFSECGDTASLDYNGLVPVTGNPSQKPSLKAGIYKDLGKFLAFNRKATESVNEIFDRKQLQETMSSSHVLWNDANANRLSFERAEIWNLFLIVMLLFLLAESLLGLPVTNISFSPQRL